MGYRLFFVALILCLASYLPLGYAYAPGETVPMSRRGQHLGMRSEWHDALGRHCPRFRVNSEAVLPIPRAIGISEDQLYKISLMFGKERYTTPWLLILGLKNTRVPMIEVKLVHFGEELRGVQAKVVPLPDSFLEKHPEVASHYNNITRWPKHLLLKYQWQEEVEVDVVSGLGVLFVLAFILTTFLSLYILQSSKDKLSRFVVEQLGEPSTSAPLEVGKVD